MRKVTTIAVPKKVAVAARAAGESIAVPLRPLPEVHPRHLRAVADEHAGDEQDHGDEDLPGALEGVGQPAVAVEVGPPGDHREGGAARHEADEEPPAPVEREAAAPDLLDASV
jgi:hypothetical protein